MFAPLEWHEELKREGDEAHMTDMTDIVIGGQIDPETGEVVASGELAALHEQARAAAESFVALDRVRLDLTALMVKVEDAIAAQFPQLKEMKTRQARLEADYAEQQTALREAALAFWKSLPSGAGKTLLGGAISIRESQRVTHYDPVQALEWCEECNPALVKREADKTKLTALIKGGVEIPEAVMKLETVAETAIKEAALAELAAV